MNKLRLASVIVQPVFMLDDGETLTERVVEPVRVSAADWPTYATTGFVAATEALQAQVDAEAAEPQTNGRPTNRQQRRAATKRAKSKPTPARRT